jgi:hypoxanthine phosphoribosyltransferase
MKLATIHDQAYEYHSWEDLGQEIFAVAQQVLKSDQSFDRVIALAKGGLTFARSLNDLLAIKELSSIQIEFYTGIGEHRKTPVITQSLPVTIKDEHILLFDDIVDKGDTMSLAVEYLKYHGAASITTTALLSKPWSTFAPDFVANTTQAWVIFPNESRETIGLLRKMWTKKGDSPDQISRQLLEIGLPKAEVEFFMHFE